MVRDCRVEASSGLVRKALNIRVWLPQMADLCCVERNSRLLIAKSNTSFLKGPLF